MITKEQFSERFIIQCLPVRCKENRESPTRMAELSAIVKERKSLIMDTFGFV